MHLKFGNTTDVVYGEKNAGPSMKAVPEGGQGVPKGLLFMAFDFSTAHPDEFHAWYEREHIPERLRVPGFINAERWIDEDSPQIHVAIYDLANPEILSSPAYLAVAGDNQSPWTKRVTAMCRRIMRYEGRQVLPGDRLAAPEAQGLAVVSMNIEPAIEAEFTAWYDTEHLPRLALVPGVLSARRYIASDTESERRFLALYHLRHSHVARSDAWTQVVNTPQARSMGALCRDPLTLRMKRNKREQ